eukprot:m.3084 g.3084  ORF g.3084 m.3084 type:complete len:513 (+) comp2261_c0_seq1:87-1625(+)
MSASKPFNDVYTAKCTAQQTCPLSSVRAHLGHGTLAFHADRLSSLDWEPVFQALKSDRTLCRIALSSTHFKDQQAARRKRRAQSSRNPFGHNIGVPAKAPAIHSTDQTYALCRALRNCLTNTTALTSLELYGIPLRPRDLELITAGLAHNDTVVQINLRGCRIGDEGVKTLARGLELAERLVAVDLGGCSLTALGAETVAAVIKFHMNKRQTESWPHSLRRGQPDFAAMNGLRCVTLSNNPRIGNEGCERLVDVLLDDKWLLELNLQNCGLTIAGAHMLAEMLQVNDTLVNLNLARNDIETSALAGLRAQLDVNGAAAGHRLRWKELDPQPGLDDIASFATAMKQTRRKKRSRGAPKTRKEGPSTASAALAAAMVPAPAPMRSLEEDARAVLGSSSSTFASSRPAGAPSLSVSSAPDMTLSDRGVSSLPIREEDSAILRRMAALEAENARLRQQLDLFLSHTHAGQLLPRAPPQVEMDDLLSTDDQTLEQIEESFHKLHLFLDQLQDDSLDA